MTHEGNHNILCLYADYHIQGVSESCRTRGKEMRAKLLNLATVYFTTVSLGEKTAIQRSYRFLHTSKEPMKVIYIHAVEYRLQSLWMSDTPSKRRAFSSILTFGNKAKLQETSSDDWVEGGGVQSGNTSVVRHELCGFQGCVGGLNAHMLQLSIMISWQTP
jgi:hypothetical protein